MSEFQNSLEYDTRVVIYSEKQKESSIEVYLYLEDLNEDGELFFNVDYKIVYNNGSLQQSNGMESLNTILEAYGFNNYNDLSSYFHDKYEHDNNAFNNIIKDIKSKGINIMIDESESDYNGCSMWGK